MLLVVFVWLGFSCFVTKKSQCFQTNGDTVCDFNTPTDNHLWLYSNALLLHADALHCIFRDKTSLHWSETESNPTYRMSKFDTFSLHRSCYPSFGHATVAWLVEGATLTQEKWTKPGLIQRDMVTKKMVRGREARNKIRSIKVFDRFQHASLNRPNFCYRSSTIGRWCQRLKIFTSNSKTSLSS